MKKTGIIIIVIIILSINKTQAQTNTFPTTGNVGIGTTSPSSLLEVVGDVSLSGLSGSILALGQGYIVNYNNNLFLHTGGGMDQGLFLGENAGMNENDENHGNVGIGYNTLTLLGDDDLDGSHNTAVGWMSLSSLNGADKNTMVGSRSGQNLSSGQLNTCVGWNVFLDATSGSRNVALGGDCGSSILDGSNNTLIGYQAGVALTTIMTAVGENNTFVGYQAGNSATTGDFNIMIGSGTTTSMTNFSNELNIGNTLYGDLSNDHIGIGITPNNITAILNLKAGSSSAGTAPIKLTNGTLMTTPEAGAMEYNGDNFSTTSSSTLRTTIQGTLLTLSSTKTVSNTTTETSLLNGAITLPANALISGRTVHVVAYGYLSTDATAGNVTKCETWIYNNNWNWCTVYVKFTIEQTC